MLYNNALLEFITMNLFMSYFLIKQKSQYTINVAILQ